MVPTDEWNLKKGSEKPMNKPENDNPTIITDLAVDEARQDEIKGGLGQVITYTYTVRNPGV
jgi:hypothetical protein